MLLNCIRLFVCVFCVIYYAQSCVGQYVNFGNIDATTSLPLPFPACQADNLECLRRGLRTFFFLMNSGYMGMQPVDPMILNSLTVALPEEQLSFLMRRINVTGAKWTKLAERKFNLPGGKNGVRFINNLHVTGEITMMTAARIDPFFAHITMDIQDVESNITYTWAGQRGFDNKDYIFVGPERVAVRNSRTPFFFVQPTAQEDAPMIEQVLQARPTVLEHLSNEITIALMHSVVDNFRLFASKVPAKNYYLYADNSNISN
ncbi:uncharacterized protein LOC123870415 isoform X1 [Maniola jurtina]|uniref:uncharacterized protein LOC123870415 isoform X1 n=1 Tax=Maniola jurtina TaxID=191418 RepID=UPI001E68ED00|nr:uncharacterized protein LOC123870415 isoform X1 [Maniola jurtina]